MTRAQGLNVGPDGRPRCWWCGDDPLYMAYHDREWGFPLLDDAGLFEKVCLGGFQAGLSWITILRKRENFRRAFRDFDPEAVSRYNRRSVERLMQDEGIVRNRAKIESTINNARRALELIEDEGGLVHFFQSYRPDARSRPRRMTRNTLLKLAKTEESTALSRSLKKRGWSFVGPTTMYALMQSVGLVNDHLDGCHVRERASEMGRRWDRI